MSERPCILFTAFEPSGDEHAAAVIVELRRLLPDVPIYALGGPRMAEAGAEVLEQTSGMGLMLADSAGHVLEHYRRVGRLRKWLAGRSVAVHVPTDSPAANWSFCKLLKRSFPSPEPGRPRTRVVHLVAPQVWAWARWRVRRLRKLTDLVLCLLPFEPKWFRVHRVPAKFIGHPLFDDPLDPDALEWQAVHYPSGEPRFALLPGSRSSELKAHWPIMLDAFERIKRRWPDAAAVVAAVHDGVAEQLRKTAPQREDLRIVSGQTDAALRWADAVLAVSGTVTLKVARHRKPMTILYRVRRVTWNLVGRWLMATRTFTLPNLIALGRAQNSRQGHVVREFIPFWGDAQPLVDELGRLIEDRASHDRQVAALERVVGRFERHHAGREAAEAIADKYRDAIEEMPDAPPEQRGQT